MASEGTIPHASRTSNNCQKLSKALNRETAKSTLVTEIIGGWEESFALLSLDV